VLSDSCHYKYSQGFNTEFEMDDQAGEFNREERYESATSATRDL
jgi:hypothetical protein